MKKASSSLLLLAFAAFFVSANSFAQVRRPIPGQPVPQPQRPIPGQELPEAQAEIIQEQVNVSVRSLERLRLTELLRLPRHQEGQLEVLSLQIQAQSMIQGPTHLEVRSLGRILSSHIIRRQMQEVSVVLPAGAKADSIELSVSADTYLSLITAKVRSQRIPGPRPGPGQLIQVQPNSLVTLQVHQPVRGYARIPLEMTARQQLGMTLEGAQIERVIVEAQPIQYGRPTSIQVELNGRMVGDLKYLSLAQAQLPLRVQSIEEVRSLALIVNGDAQISQIKIRVGQVRPHLPELPHAERIYVGRQLDVRMPLILTDVLRYESRLIRSIRIEGRSVRQIQAHLSLLGSMSELQGAAILGTVPSQALIVLRRPMSAHELRLEAQAAVIIDSMEIEFDTIRR